MSTTLQRTQIYLPSDLREDIDRERRLTGESLGEFLRAGARERLKEKRKRKKDLEKLAESIASLKPSKTRKEVDAWIKEIRRDREESDKRMEDRWEKARQASKQNVSS